jgi:hypothetical protein
MLIILLVNIKSGLLKAASPPYLSAEYHELKGMRFHAEKIHNSPKSPYESVTRTGKLNPVRVNTLRAYPQIGKSR